MRTLSNPELLELWERGSGLHPLDRALQVLARALPGERYDALADWPLGKRNSALLELHRLCFGSALSGWIACPQCGVRLEFSLDAGNVIQQRNAAAEKLTVNGLDFRMLTSRDLAAIADQNDERVAALELLRRTCMRERTGSNGELEKALESNLDSIGEQLSEADPLAEVLLDFECADCKLHWREPLDIAAWLWAEIEAHARRLLYDVHMLASAYGWSEREILSLGEPRRALYLQMVQA